MLQDVPEVTQFCPSCPVRTSQVIVRPVPARFHAARPVTPLALL